MKKIILLLITGVLFSSCLSPLRISVHERRLRDYQNRPRQYYYKTFPTHRERVRVGRKYVPYFRNGRW